MEDATRNDEENQNSGHENITEAALAAENEEDNANDEDSEDDFAPAQPNDVVLPNLERHGAEDLDETAQPAERGSNAVVMIEQLDGINLREIMRADGLVDPIVTFIDAYAGTPEIV